MNNEKQTLETLVNYKISRDATLIIRGGGFTATDDLAKWRKNIEDGIIDRR
ncbi:hypothetical protein [Aquimarina sp. AU474]|uniref:hypothetical protein n=1 Tax=Aquimarina sp. AU474 TaxID=2108529 RepID=UPI0013569FF7|nr:hypothetical protein [Aquimarina sp. AU474]